MCASLHFESTLS